MQCHLRCCQGVRTWYWYHYVTVGPRQPRRVNVCSGAAVPDDQAPAGTCCWHSCCQQSLLLASVSPVPVCRCESPCPDYSLLVHDDHAAGPAPSLEVGYAVHQHRDQNLAPSFYGCCCCCHYLCDLGGDGGEEVSGGVGWWGQSEVWPWSEG